MERIQRPYACVECGQRFAILSPRPPFLRSSLKAHWQASGHGPRQVQADAIDRARFSLLGDEAPPPEDVYGTGHRPDHRP
jgi:hypothetical protein